jgi:exosortase A-associated hydrolase 2
MSSAVRGVAFKPFFLPAQHGDRFCIFHPAEGVLRGCVVYVHPFAEEMNKSRRMAALQSRALAAEGYAVLQMDLFGCGDSSGDFGQASWDIWRQDVALGVRWISERASGKVTLWGLRLGALLALDAAPLCEPLPERFLLWQPVLTGEGVLTQFLRLRIASEMLSEASEKTGVRELRAILASGSTIEVGGYALAPSLVMPMDALKLADQQPSSKVVHWLEIVPEPGRELSPAALRVADAWVRNGFQMGIQCVPGAPFWNTIENTECAALIAATTKILADEPR